ncbi:MAG: hypothetical protein JWM16_5136 [Verrucomicrobiales bacterium]|nr:hypothetical protein [Verrucomicrobiales bacterium]
MMLIPDLRSCTGDLFPKSNAVLILVLFFLGSLFGTLRPAQAAVVINELFSSPSDLQLSYRSNGIPQLDSGISWMEPGFSGDGSWSSGTLPAGYGFGGLSTDLSSTMKGKTPSVYLRKEFYLTPEQAAFTDPLVLTVDYNDGFVAYLNGREVARANCGATNRFIFANQPAYNVNTNSGAVQIILGPVSTLVVPGRNVLAIQAHNADQPSTTDNPSLIVAHLPTPEFKINAGLQAAAGIIVSLRPSAFNFDDAAGGSKVHANTNGVVTDSILGDLAPNGWLASGANPSSSPSWQGLQMVAFETPGAGVAGSGALQFSVSQTGANQAASFRAPAVDMTGGWNPGHVSVTDLASTVIRFRSRAAGGAQFKLRLDPAFGQEGNALSGFPLISPTNEAAITFAAASGGARVMAISSTGAQSQSQVGSLSSLSLFAFASNDVRNMTFRIIEDATVGAGYNGSKGHLRGEITQPGTAGTAWGFSYGNIPVQSWTPGNVSSQDLQYASFQFACKIPAGVAFQVWAEPGSGGFSNRVDWGTLMGDGTWQLVRRDFASLSGAANFRAALNAANSRNFKLLFQGSPSLGVGTWIQLDDFQVVPWRKYEVRLADATNGQPAFINYLNANNLLSFVPTFEKFSDASAGTQTLVLDDYEVIYSGTNASSITNFVWAGAAGGPWKYFAGLAEPSGGVFDPGLITSQFIPPAGEEGAYATPASFVPWLELFNNSAVSADISGWFLTDKAAQWNKWAFPPNTVIGPGGYLLVLCDGRDEANAPAGPAEYLHANFSLNSSGEYLGLFDNAGVWMDGLPAGYPNQVSFAAYGRNPGNPSQFGFLSTATPGTNNVAPFFSLRTDAPQFKAPDGTNDLLGGIYSTASLSLLLTNQTSGSIIRYTVNGSDPTETNGTIYAGPLVLAQSSDKTGLVVRARSFFPGWLPSGIKTHTYLLRQAPALTNVPALFLTGQKERAFYAPYGLLSVVGGSFQAASGGGGIWVASGPQSYDEILGSGSPFEREVHMEYYFPQGYYPTNQDPIREDVGLRVSSSPYQRPRMKLSGAEANSPWTPSDPTEKPSFNISFQGDYGISKLNYRLFPNYDIKDFQHLRLRAGKNDSVNPFMTDEFVRRLWTDMDHVGPRGLFCSLYLNGVYKGIFNLTERVRAPMFQAHYRSTVDWDVCYAGDWVNGDRSAFDQLLTTLNQDLSSLASYQSAAALLDVENAADYYLLNIYCAMWDWPENNFVIERERSTGPPSRFRFSVWDAEGAFNVNGYYAKPVSFDTINELNTKNVDIANIWKRLKLSPEFRLKFADRVNFHMNTGGVLDDRDPDAAGPGMSHFQIRFNELATEVAPLVKYNSGQSLATNLFTSWTAPTTGRRSYLLGNTPGHQMLRDAGLWPVTEPPVFSQYGGNVPPGYELAITSTVAAPGQTATIYFTLDGTDPRLAGGALAPIASLYTSPVAVTNVVTVKARARNDVTGEWSPISQATFAPNAVPASGNNMVIAELMYHPPAPGTNEIAAGFTAGDDFEFIRLLNIGAQALDLSGVSFSVGVTFNFGSGSVHFVNPGASVLVVKNRAAFRVRYGNFLDSRIAGEYLGNLSNSGERLALVSGTNVIRDFVYADGGIWPESPDGDGPSLLLRAPLANPDHSQATNWIASAVPGGLPSGSAPQMSFATWGALIWGTNALGDLSVRGPAADPDGDGIPNFTEYVLGLHPKRVQPGKTPRAAIELFNGLRYMTMEYTLLAGATEGSATFQVSSNLSDWVSGPPHTELISTAPNAEGTISYKYRDNQSLDTTPFHFLRLQVTAP